MKCRISQDTYDALKAATLAGDIDSFSFQYVHKGVEFSMESKNDSLDQDEWEDMLLEIYFDNDLPELIDFYPEFEDNELVIDASATIELNTDGESSELWEMSKVRTAVGSELSNILGMEIGEEDMLLHLTMSAQDDDNGTIESYGFSCIHPETGEEFDLTENQSIKAKIKAYVYNWANDKCYMGSGPANCFFIEIIESTVGEFYENYSGRVELNVV